MLAALSVPAGALLALAALADMADTLLHPSRRGPLSWKVSLAIFWATHALAARRRSATVLSFAGPAAMAAHFLLWALLIWVGFTLVYVPFMHGHAALNALYLSGASLTTIGFGDVVPPTHALRLASVIEGAMGLATISASISFLLSVYPLVSRERQVAARLADAGVVGSDGARQFVEAAGRHELAQLHRDLIDLQQDLKRFPVLALFRPTQQRESLMTLLEGVCWICLQACWGPVPERSEQPVRFHGTALRRSCEELMSELSMHLVNAGAPTEPENDPNEFAARCDVFLRALSAAHLQEYQPLRAADRAPLRR